MTLHMWMLMRLFGVCLHQVQQYICDCPITRESEDPV